MKRMFSKSFAIPSPFSFFPSKILYPSIGRNLFFNLEIENVYALVEN